MIKELPAQSLINHQAAIDFRMKVFSISKYRKAEKSKYFPNKRSTESTKTIFRNHKFHPLLLAKARVRKSSSSQRAGDEISVLSFSFNYGVDYFLKSLKNEPRISQ